MLAARTFKNGLFSADLGTRMMSLFAMYTIIGTNTRSNHRHRYEWPLLYLFVGKTTQEKKRCANRAFKNGLFSAILGAKTTSLFAMYTM
jgi:hypothetical protein